MRALEAMVERREPTGVVKLVDVPSRCQRAPNATFDRSFVMFTCNQRDARCPFHGPSYVLDNDGRHFECRKMAER